ncbi:MAG: hypothetical protein K6T81_13330 [Alicyclobacillus macrosporangiidus]|uniref:hypothetical protein n=1 Tax=Alicyclobacillus macrosporangiidus TaxID=392015 RepID=UPI0026EDA0F4|nr:hypothetical protein [Alicyclobacillus macrosporangiidus]MCL6599703.1 hypothetical protein [Alicyclobacillus macrosporangiidus]
MDIRLDEIHVRAAADAPPVTDWIRQEAARALQQRLGRPVEVEVGSAEIRPAPRPGTAHPGLDRGRRARGGGAAGRPGPSEASPPGIAGGVR